MPRKDEEDVVMRMILVAGTIGALALAGCATPKAGDAAAVAEKEHATCAAMAKMGPGSEHDHAAEKSGSPGAMAQMHQRCKAHAPA
jgi:hypothetical protein